MKRKYIFPIAPVTSDSVKLLDLVSRNILVHFFYKKRNEISTVLVAWCWYCIGEFSMIVGKCPSKSIWSCVA